MRTGPHDGANFNWTNTLNPDGKSARTTLDATLCVLMDIREELRAITRRLDCQEFLMMPCHLRNIVRNTAKKPKKQKART